jgi:hypothetical protein
MARLPSEGAVLQYTDATTPTSYVAFAFCREIPSPTSSKPEIDATALEDLATVTFLGKTDYGSLAVQFFMDPTDQDQYEAAFAAQLAGTALNWLIVDPKSESGSSAGAKHFFVGRVSGLTSSRVVNGMISGTMNIRVTGAASFSPEA